MDTKDLHVLLFNPSIENGGVEKNLIIFSNLLRKKIVNLSIISSSVEKKKLFNKKINFLSLNKNKIKSNKRIVYYIYSSFCLIKYFLKNLEKKILVISFQSNILSILICKLFFRKIIIRLNTAPDKYINNVYKKFFFKCVYKMADLIIVNSKIFKQELKKIFNIKSYVIYNFVKKIYLHQDKKKKKYLQIVNVGRVTDQKDQITLLKAIKIVNNYLKCKVNIIGNGHLLNNLKSYAKKNRLKNINFYGEVNNAYRFIAKADLFILTSKYEGMPNVLIEAIQSKTYVISTNCKTGPRELLLNGRYGSLVPVGDYHKIAKEIIKYKRKPFQFKKKINLAYNSLDRFDNFKNFSIYLYLISKLQ
jgi:glycosyltransferase involved in cell wall biosynthesis